MSEQLLTLAGVPGALEWTHVALNARGLPRMLAAPIVYTWKTIRHPCREETIQLTMVAGENFGKSRLISVKMFIRDYLRSGLRLYIYCCDPNIDLIHDLICLDFIRDVLSDAMRRRIDEIREELESLKIETWQPDSDIVPRGNNEEEADYY